MPGERDIAFEDERVPAPAYTPRSDLWDAPHRPDAHAVIIGIDRYVDAGIPDLHFARADAEAVHAALTDPEVGRFNPENVTLLVDEAATQRAIRSAIGTKLRQRAEPDDTVVIYFAGHGAPETDTRPDGVRGSDGFQKFLIPHDAERSDLYSTAIPMDVVQEMFKRIAARSLVFFLDACYSGNAGGRTFARDDFGTRAAHLTDEFLDEVAGEGRCVITSCDVSEVSIESPELGHGLFTHYLVKGLRGEADVNGSGTVDLDELYDYVCRRVSSEARQRNARMQPVRKGETRGRVLLARYETPARRRARELRGEAAAAEARGALDDAVARWREAVALDPADADAPLALAALEGRLAREAGARRAELARKTAVLRGHFSSGALTEEEFAQGVDVLHAPDGELTPGDAELRRLTEALVAGRIQVARYARTVRAVTGPGTDPAIPAAAWPTPAAATPVVPNPVAASAPAAPASVAPVPVAAARPDVNVAPPAAANAPRRAFASRTLAIGAVAAVALAAVLWSASSGSDPAPAAADSTAAAPADTALDPIAATGDTVVVKMVGDENGYRFEPAELTVEQGDAVTFVLASGGPHDVTFDEAAIPDLAAAQLDANIPTGTPRALRSAMLERAGESVTVSFAGVPAGSYAFQCTPHLAMGMKGVITVK